MTVSLNQCLECERYVTRPRTSDGRDPQRCVECRARDGLDGGLPLADIRGPESAPVSVELLGLLTEECGEVGQRVGKILRWGWKADFAGTTQAHKLEVELGDVLAAMVLAVHNGLVDGAGIAKAFDAKMAAFRKDAAGPRQRLTHAKVPAEAIATIEIKP